ncbi:DNA repair protein RecO [Paenibacillus sp. J2TS4]|uniref:DNA repair protein RecO n=1 Tax=Paenibacillus sp. J2TS4 TaxID=2807194 RepID=UPI001B0313E6|nr:DNA repair protein RecO [Paenibacillus sp. J2TS4]GIP35823.1 DNA repair protein RecO [Paenibacillus sp. J2TS4]
MLYRTEGIVIRTMDYGEGHKILSLFTRSLGKVSVMVRGAKKVKSRYSAIAQLFTHGDFVIYKGSQMGTLNHGEPIHSYQGLREDLHKAAYAAYLVELADRILPEAEPDLVMFEQLTAGLSAIDEGKDPTIVLHIIEMKMLALSGYHPQLDECVSCGRAAGEMVLSPMQGGILCSACKGKDHSAVPVPATILRLLRLFQRVDLRMLGTADVKPETKKRLKAAMRAFMDAHLDIRWKSRNFIDQMEKYNI